MQLQLTRPRPARTKIAVAGCLAVLGLAGASAAPADAASGGSTYEAPAVERAPTRGVKVTRHVRRGKPIKVKGRLKVRRRVVSLQRRVGRRWKTVKRFRTSRRGGFRSSWKPRRSGTYRLRLRYRTRGARAASTAERLPGVNVYRRTKATWYGPTLWGNGVACGGKLERDTIGVAHKTLPCGTTIRFRHRGRTAVGKVIDRGPFRAGYAWDLTQALAKRLAFESVGAGPIWSTR